MGSRRISTNTYSSDSDTVRSDTLDDTDEIGLQLGKLQILASVAVENGEAEAEERFKNYVTPTMVLALFGTIGLQNDCLNSAQHSLVKTSKEVKKIRDTMREMARSIHA
jgi:hypothetical protein